MTPEAFTPAAPACEADVLARVDGGRRVNVVRFAGGAERSAAGRCGRNLRRRPSRAPARHRGGPGSGLADGGRHVRSASARRPRTGGRAPLDARAPTRAVRGGGCRRRRRARVRREARRSSSRRSSPSGSCVAWARRSSLRATTFRFGRDRQGDLSLLANLDFDVRRVPVLENVSSSRIRELVHGGEPGRAARLLGRPAEVEGIVVHGDERGRELGFPTANLAVPPGCSSRPTACTPAGRATGSRRSRSARIRSSTASSGASRRTCSISTAISTTSGSSSRSGDGSGARCASSRSRRSSSRSARDVGPGARGASAASQRSPTRGSATQPIRPTPGRGKSMRWLIRRPPAMP